jgi:endonuclease/exonuclease/phosphatase family metal-dependent hydrolase
MIVTTWNVQWCRGIDGKVDPARIAKTARELADFDVLCLQEVAVNFPGLLGSHGEDEIAQLAAGLPGYLPIFGVATDLLHEGGGRRQFGNAIFTRLPVLQVFRHSLPWPADASVPSMQRMALEAVVATRSGPLRVVCTHLEYYSLLQRRAQIEALRALHEEACEHARRPRSADERPGGSFDIAPRPASALVCGDFNFKPEDPEHQLMIDPFAEGTPDLVDVWSAVHPNETHQPTVGVYEEGWPLYCCDFAFATEDLVPRLRAVTIDSSTQASDHQPMIVELDDR